MLSEQLRGLSLLASFHDFIFTTTIQEGIITHKQCEAMSFTQVSQSGFGSKGESKRYFFTVKTALDEYIEEAPIELFQLLGVGNKVKVVRTKLFYQRYYKTRFEQF